jgi:hypothetical protein
MLDQPLFQVTAPAGDLTLLTMDELRAATGQSDQKSDATLKRLGSRVADAITQACKVATDGATPPTLRKESVVDTFRSDWLHRRRDRRGHDHKLILSRRPIVSVTSVVEAGTTLDPTSDYEVRPGEGALVRLFGGMPAHWVPGVIVVTYAAGWASVPEGLKFAAEKLTRFYWFESMRNPLVRQDEIAGIGSTTYWNDSPTDPSIPQDVMDDLGPYLNLQIG